MTQYLLPALGGSGALSLAETGISASDLTLLLDWIEHGQATKTLARKALEAALEHRRPVTELLAEMEGESENLEADLRASGDAILQQNPSQVEDFRAGKKKVFAYLMGQTMRSVGGKADPMVVRRILEEALREESG